MNILLFIHHKEHTLLVTRNWANKKQSGIPLLPFSVSVTFSRPLKQLNVYSKDSIMS